MTMRRLPLVLGAATLLTPVLSCSKPSSQPTPARVTGANNATATPRGNTAGPARRVPPPRDSMAKLRAAFVAQIMQQIAGHENEPAERVFKNVQVLKGLTAAELVHKMDRDYGAALSWNCTNCHRFAAQGNFASDTSADKRRARFMQQMTNDLNQVQLPKLYPKETPQVGCVTCHRGYNEPPDSVLIPERGKPGGPPVLPPRPGL
ncbi:MAG TPA: photosynthetic reaction center cytochrome c subunit family protein [Gemmatimonadaceae bacterium]